MEKAGKLPARLSPSIQKLGAFSNIKKRSQWSPSTMRPPQPPGHMVINLKTTVMTQGGHSGVIVHSGIQSSSSFSSLNGLGSWNSAPSRFPMIETPGGTRMASMASPLPLTIGPSTSQDNLNTSWSRPSPQYPTRATSYEQLNGYREPLPPRPRLEPREVRISSPPPPPPLPPRRPATPPSPVYDFTGRNTPPDEFIKPSKITLNVFDPGRKSPVPYEVGLRKSQNISTADALINDQVTTTTTVEVFRAPYDPSNPNRTVQLPAAPAPGLDDRPQLLRLDGPGYEKWQSLRTETLINDRPVVNKAVKWNEKLVERGSETEYELTRSRSPFANAVEPPRPHSAGYQYYVPTVHHVDERLVPPMVTRATSPYMIQSPSEFSMTSHPMITSSQEELRRRADSALSYQQPLITESPSQLAQLRVKESYLNGNLVEQRSPLYVEPRGQEEYRGREGRREIPVDNYGYSTVDRRPSRRSKSSNRNRSRVEELRARSVSPLSKRPSWAEDPNRLPNLPLKLTPADSTHLYQTRDAFDNIITQFRELEFDIGHGLLFSPSCGSSDSLISEVSARNDRAKSDYLETKDEPMDIYKIAEEFYNSRNPLMTSQSSENIYSVPRNKELKMRREEENEEEEHIYEDIDSIRPSVSYSHLAHIYASVAPEYRDEPPPLPPRRRKEEPIPMTAAFLSTDSTPWLPETPETTPSKTPEVPRPPSSTKSSQSSSAKSSTSSSSSEEAEREDIHVESEGSLGTTTADSSSDEFGPAFTEISEEDWPPPPSIMRRKKVHPDGHVFPRITSSIVMMPQLPEDKEFTSSEAEEGGIKLSPLSLETFDREPKGGSSSSSAASSSSGESNKEKNAQLLALEEDLPFADASPRPP